MRFLLTLLWVTGMFMFLSPAHAQQGIRGEILWVGGNQLPGPGKSVSPQLGVRREIYVYEVTTIEKENHNGPVFPSVTAALITKAESRTDGTFKIKLPPGEYSVFVKEPQGMFANLIGSDGKINPVVVSARRFTWISITIDYEAVY